MGEPKGIFAELQAKVEKVAQTKAALDAASEAVQKASKAHQDALDDAEKTHKVFASEVGQHLPSVRVKS